MLQNVGVGYYRKPVEKEEKREASVLFHRTSKYNRNLNWGHKTYSLVDLISWLFQ